MALVLVGGLPDKFRIGSEWNNYMYRSIYAAIVSCSCVNNQSCSFAHCLLFQELIDKSAEYCLDAPWQAPGVGGLL